MRDAVITYGAHEDIPLLVLHHQRVEDLLDGLAFGVRRPDDAHAGGVQHDLAAVFVFVVLPKFKHEGVISEGVGQLTPQLQEATIELH